MSPKLAKSLRAREIRGGVIAAAIKTHLVISQLMNLVLGAQLTAAPSPHQPKSAELIAQLDHVINALRRPELCRTASLVPARKSQRSGRNSPDGTGLTRIAPVGSACDLDGTTARRRGELMEARRIETFDVGLVKAVSEVLGQTDAPGLSNREIDQLLAQVKIRSRPVGNKRDSLYEALLSAQTRQKCGNPVSAFIARAMHPSRYPSDMYRFTQLQDQLNEALVYFGWSVTATGGLKRGAAASTLSEGAALAGSLSRELTRRGTHAEVLRYCTEELITKSLFHATTEAAKSIPNRLRSMTGLLSDGEILYGGVFGAGGGVRPMLLINEYRSDSDVSEHKGFKNLLTGIQGHFRNPRAHSSRIDSDENLADFYDAFALFSYAHRRLDSSTLTTAS